MSHVEDGKVRASYTYKGNPTLRAFRKSKKRVRGIRGPFSSGKSSACVWELFQMTMEQAPNKDGIRHTRYACVRNTYNQLEKTTIKTFFEWFPPAIWGKYNETKHVYVMRWNDCEMEVWFMALDREDHVANLLSLELTGAWVNEAREVLPSIIDGIDGRLDRYPSRKNGNPGATFPCMIMDTNSPDESSWWYEKFEVDKPESWEQFVQPASLLYDLSPEGDYINWRMNPLAENTAGNSPGYFLNLPVGKTREYIKVYCLNEYTFSRNGLPVFAEYKDHLHFNEKLLEPTPGLPIWRGWDYGRTPACVMVQRDVNGHVNIFDEQVFQDMGIIQATKLVKTYCAANYPGFRFIDIGDPAGGQKGQHDEKTCFSLQKDMGVDVRPGLQTWQKRFESVNELLIRNVDGRPTLQVGSKAKTVRQGFQGGYQYRRLRTSDQRFSLEPDKNEYSHPHDVLQYVCTHLVFGDMEEGERAPPDTTDVVASIWG